MNKKQKSRATPPIIINVDGTSFQLNRSQKAWITRWVRRWNLTETQALTKMTRIIRERVGRGDTIPEWF